MSPPLAQVPHGSKGMDNLAAAAKAALDGIQKVDGNEQAGVILKGPDGKYYPTAPVSNAQDTFSLRVQMEHGWNIAGIYHNHPGNDAAAQYFSPDDIQIAHKFGVPSYIRFAKDNSIRQYVPGKTQLQQMDDPAGSQFPIRSTRGDAFVVPPPTQATPPMLASNSQPANPSPSYVPSQTIPTNSISPVYSNR